MYLLYYIIYIMNKNYNFDECIINCSDNVKKSLKKWNKKSSCDKLQFNEQKENILYFSLDNNIFTITCPESINSGLFLLS